jgi:uncharacterized membrane protein
MTRWLMLALAIFLMALAAALYVSFVEVDRLPEQVPTHWDINFRPDRFTPREQIWTHLLLFPAVMGLMLLLAVGLPWLSPRHFQVEDFRATWDYIMMLVVGLFGYLFAVYLWNLLSGGQDPEVFGKAFLAGFFVAFALMGNVMGKVQRNFWMGVRTPWTLASETVWARTHREAAWTFVAAGLLGLVGLLLDVPFWVCFLGVMAAALWPVLYSLLLYKRLEREGKLEDSSVGGARRER